MPAWAGSGGVSDGVPAEAVDDGEGVAGIGVDGDPASLAGTPQFIISPESIGVVIRPAPWSAKLTAPEQS